MPITAKDKKYYIIRTQKFKIQTIALIVLIYVLLYANDRIQNVYNSAILNVFFKS